MKEVFTRFCDGLKKVEDCIKQKGNSMFTIAQLYHLHMYVLYV